MVGKRWTTQEVAYLLYYLIHGIRHDLIPRLLAEHQIQRTQDAIRQKIHVLRKVSPLLFNLDGSINYEAVSNYLDNMVANGYAVPSSRQPLSSQDAEVITSAVNVLKSIFRWMLNMPGRYMMM